MFRATYWIFRDLRYIVWNRTLLQTSFYMHNVSFIPNVRSPWSGQVLHRPLQAYSYPPTGLPEPRVEPSYYCHKKRYADVFPTWTNPLLLMPFIKFDPMWQWLLRQAAWVLALQCSPILDEFICKSNHQMTEVPSNSIEVNQTHQYVWLHVVTHRWLRS